MKLLFEKSKIRIGIDTIKIKFIRNIFGTRTDPINQLIENLKRSFDPDEISIFQKDGYHYLKNIDSNFYLSKIYKTDTYSGMIEIFGMCQTITNFKLTEHHATILSIIGDMKNIEMTLDKMDVSLDFFYPHDRSFVYDSSKTKSLDFVDFLNEQIKSRTKARSESLNLH
jgi:phage regulator Rha-like protein